MAVSATTHLNFRGDARAALEFYRSVFDGDLVAVTYAEAHSVTDPGEAEQVMFGMSHGSGPHVPHVAPRPASQPSTWPVKTAGPGRKPWVEKRSGGRLPDGESRGVIVAETVCPATVCSMVARA